MGVVRLAGEVARGGHTPQEVCVLLGPNGNLFLPPPCLSWLGKKHLWSQMAALYPGNPTCSGGWDPEPQGLSWEGSLCPSTQYLSSPVFLPPQCLTPPTMPPSSHNAPILPQCLTPPPHHVAMALVLALFLIWTLTVVYHDFMPLAPTSMYPPPTAREMLCLKPSHSPMKGILSSTFWVRKQDQMEK